MSSMRVAVIDVGSNTARLLVANIGADGAIVPVDEEREYLRLGAEIERTGTLSSKKIAAAAATCRGFAQTAAELGAERTALIVTAPGRQAASGPALTASLAGATGLGVRVLSAGDEGRLAYEGAVARVVGERPAVVAVVDVGGGSTEIAVGTPHLGAAWIQSADLGALRLTRAHLNGDPPTRAEIAAARDAVAAALADMRPPAPDLALAVGGSARALAKMVDGDLTREALADAIDQLTGRSAAKVARRHGIGERRAATLLAGAVILEGVQGHVSLPLQVAHAGLREGLAFEVLARAAA